MSRPSKNIHLLALLRRELGLEQRDVASRVHVHVRTIRRIELGSQRPSWRLAQEIGNAYDVDPVCLMTNDLGQGLRTLEGKPWTAKTRLEIQNRLKRWGDLADDARRAQKAISAVLLRQYLQAVHLIQKLPQSQDKLLNWSRLFDQSLHALWFSEPAARDWKGKDLQTNAQLETVIDDVQAILTEIRIVKHTQKRPALNRRKTGNSTSDYVRAYAGIFGWGDRALVAKNVIESLGAVEVAEMPFRELCELVKERCLARGIAWPEKFDPFDAVVAYHEAFKK